MARGGMAGSGRRRPRSVTAVVTRTVSTLLVTVSVLATGHVVWAGWGPASDEVRVATQLGFLDEAIGDGAGPRMQGLFPEGDFFTQTLTGIAAARLAHSATTEAVVGQRDRWLGIARRSLVGVGQPQVTAPFAGSMEPAWGVFYRAWRALLVIEIATATEDPVDLQSVEVEAAALREAVQASASAVLQSYPGQAWPCDNVVGMAALARAGDLLGTADRELARHWLSRLDPLRDKDTGLLPHRVSPTGQVLDRPRASSQAIVQTFLPEVDPAAAGADWAAYRRAFVVREAGLVGVREYPVGVTGAGDVDSGPLLLGVSASASAVTLAAARRVGDTALADTLDREAELLGLGWSWGGTRRYAGGALPVGDAFLAWARSTPGPGPGQPVAPTVAATTVGGPWWAAFVAWAAWPGLVVAGLLGFARWRRGARRRAA